MVNKITNTRWHEAQKAERYCHDRLITKLGEQATHNHYEKTYRYYFGYLGIKTNQQGKTIVEIGCADYPALEWCKNMNGILIEPLPSDRLNQFVASRDDITLIKSKVEDMELPECDEVWLMNVMQHVQDPDTFIQKCKKAKVIRFFEPIDCPIETHHPHTFDESWYRNHFGDCVMNYNPSKNTKFHGANCVYGVWTC